MALQNDELIALALRELREALPDARAPRLLRASVVTRAARDVFARAGAAEAAGDGTAVAGLVLAGDWIETGLPATIESAAISGRLAAEAIA